MYECMYVYTYICMYVYMYGCMDDWMDGWIDGWMVGCRRPLSGTVFLPTSDTAAPSYSSKLPLRPSSSLIPSPSFLYSLEDLRFFLPHRLLMFVCC